MIPDDLLDQLNKLKYMERTINQIKDFTDQVINSLQKIIIQRTNTTNINMYRGLTLIFWMILLFPFKKKQSLYSFLFGENL